MKTLSKPNPPKGLTPAARRMWREIQEEYEIDDPVGLKLLGSAVESYMLVQQAQEEIRRDGLTLIDRYDQKKPHPLLAVMRDARSSMLAAMKALNLDLEPLRDKPGRPGGRI